MSTQNQPTDAKEIVLAFINALNEEDFTTARNYLSDDMIFDGVLGSRNGGDVYISDMEKMRFKYKIIKAFADGEDACLLFDITMSGITLFTCGWYHVKDGRINKLKVVFDPRPVLEMAPKK